MAPDIQRNSDDTITVSFTFKPGDSMLESELNLQAMSNEANALASGGCLKRFDTDGTPIAIGGRTLTSKGSEPKKYQTPYGRVSVSRHLYQSSFGGATYCPMEHGARVVRTATPLLAKQASFKLGAMNSNVAIADFRQSGLANTPVDSEQAAAVVLQRLSLFSPDVQVITRLSKS